MLTDIFKRDVDVIRTLPGYYQKGKWVNGEKKNFTIRANVQPTPAEVMEILPEGERTKSSYTLFTNTELFTVIENSNNYDRVLLDGTEFFVAKKEIWRNTILAHYEIIVVKREL
jgi:hypothetical protein